jgi:hypothetical protein
LNCLGAVWIWSEFLLINRPAAPNENAARRILHARTQIEAKIGTDGAIELNLAAVDPRDYARTSAAQLAAELQQELGALVPAVVDLQWDELNSSNPIQVGKVSTALKSIKRAGRQEERIALLLDEILNDLNTGTSVLLQYEQDRAKFATHALSKIRELIPRGSVGQTADERTIATLVPAFFAYAFPLNRGRLLYFLAKHLAKYPLVNEAIATTLHQTESMFVDQYRSAILDYLESAQAGKHV